MREKRPRSHRGKSRSRWGKKFKRKKQRARVKVVTRVRTFRDPLFACGHALHGGEQ